MDIKPFEDQQGSRKEQVKDMFNKIALEYDFLNHFLSFNTDKRWRKKLVRLVQKSINISREYKILDVATGTGDLAFALSKIPGTTITGLDISSEMLSMAKKKSLRKKESFIWIEGDSENLPFEDNKFDFISIAFGARNFENLDKGLSEMYRVLKPEGKVFILEFSQTGKGLFSFLYKIYSSKILPKIASIFTKEPRAYTYLPNSIQVFPYGKNMLDIMNKIGFTNTNLKELTGGIASIYVGERSKSK